LLHDAHEAYTGDIAQPLKKMLGATIIEVEWRLQRAIYEGLALLWPDAEDWEHIAIADKSLLEPEYHALFDKHIWKINGVAPANVVIEKLTPQDAADGFLTYYHALRSRSDPSHKVPVPQIEDETMGTWQPYGDYGFYA
jgi:hypothetical protein